MKFNLQLIEDQLHIRRIGNNVTRSVENMEEINKEMKTFSIQDISEENQTEDNLENDNVNIMNLKRNSEDENFMVFDSEQVERFTRDSLKQNLEWCDLISKHLNCLTLLYILQQTTSEKVISNLSVEILTQRGYGFYREQVVLTDN